MKLARKGDVSPGLLMWLEIAVLLIFFFVAGDVFARGVKLYFDERATEGSALNLTNAFNEVYKCNVAEPDADCRKSVRTVVTLDQGKEDPSSPGDDPRWIVYYQYNPSRNPDAGFEWSRLTRPDTWIVTIFGFFTNAADAQATYYDPKGIFVTWAETSSSGARASLCDKGVCYGFLERRIAEFKKLQPDMKQEGTLQKFWLVSPCHAEVEVYYGCEIDASTNLPKSSCSEKKVRLRFTKNLKPEKVVYSFCCNDNRAEFIDYFLPGTPGDALIDSDWAEHSDAFDDDGKGSNPVNRCDFQTSS